MITRLLAVCLTAFLSCAAFASDESTDAGIASSDVQVILADNRRENRRDDRQGDRDDKQDCRQEEGRVGDDKRECKQDSRKEDAGGEPEADAEEKNA